MAHLISTVFVAALLASGHGYAQAPRTLAQSAASDELVRADGKVITSSQTQLVQNLEGGIIAKILVKEGDLMQKDQILFQLDDVRFAAALREGAQGNWGLMAKVARLTVPRRCKEQGL